MPIFTKAPDFELTDGNGKQHKLYDTLDEGKNVILVFYIHGG
ncbi:redoxin domain-containing protein [Candidatus Poribacteria bacterium]|nr:redoxin domain-containing protein [Candidatus Poribacteria bacterium]